MNPPSLELYRQMYLIRAAEKSIIHHYAENEMKTPMHMSFGQEAIAVGVCGAIKAEDQIFSSYRSHAAFLAKTGDTDKFFAELYGKSTGTAQGKAGSMHLANPDAGHMCSSAIVGSCIPVAVGAAFANKRKKNGRLSCIFFGDGAPDEGVFWESLSVACLMKLPVLFVCEDNGLAVHTSRAHRQGYPSISQAIRGFDCAVFEEGTSDVEKIRQMALEGIGSIQKTGKPAFLHFTCYRYLEHVGVHEDFDAGYRSRAEFEEWRKNDCLALQRKRLLETGRAETEIVDLERTIANQIEGSLRRARTDPFPKPDDLYRGVFHEKN